MPKPPFVKAKQMGRAALKAAGNPATPGLPHLAPGLAKKPGQMPPGQYKHMQAGTGPYKPGGPKAVQSTVGTPPVPSPVASPGSAQVKNDDNEGKPAGAVKSNLANIPSFRAKRLGGGPKAGRGFLRPGFKGKGKAFGRKRRFPTV